MTVNIENFKRLRDAVAARHTFECDMTTGRCLIGICGELPEVANRELGRAFQWLGVTAHEGTLIFNGYPFPAPPQGWKEWMLQRLDRIIEAGVVEPWNAPRPVVPVPVEIHEVQEELVAV